MASLSHRKPKSVENRPRNSSSSFAQNGSYSRSFELDGPLLSKSTSAMNSSRNAKSLLAMSIPKGDPPDSVDRRAAEGHGTLEIADPRWGWERRIEVEGYGLGK